MAIMFRCIGENPERKFVEMLWTTLNEESPPQYIACLNDTPIVMWVHNRDYEEFCG